MGGNSGGIFKKFDPNATNDTLNGQVVATGTPGAQTVADPLGGMSGGRFALQQGLRNGIMGGAQGLQQQQMPQGAPRMVNFSQQQQPGLIDFTAGMGVGKRPRSPFPGGPNPDAFYGG